MKKLIIVLLICAGCTAEEPVTPVVIEDSAEVGPPPVRDTIHTAGPDTTNL